MASPGTSTGRELERQLAELRSGEHLCAIYESAAERLDVLIPFLRDGLARGERCLFVADEPAHAEMTAALSAAGVDVAAATERGLLGLATQAKAYVPGDAFAARATLDFWRRAEQRALAAGFPALRVAAEVPALLGQGPNLERWIEYEARLNDVLAGSRSLILCLYDRHAFSPQALRVLLRTHPSIVLGRRLSPNPYYETTELAIRGDEAEAGRVAWMLDQVRRIQARDDEARVLYGAALAIGGAYDLETRLECVLDAALELTDAEQTRIMLVDPATDELEVVALRGITYLADYRQPRDAGLSGQVLARNVVVRSADAQADPRTWDRELARRVGIRSWLGVPLADAEGPFGVLAVLADVAGRFGEEESRRLLSLAALAGAAIREARLRRQVQDDLAERRQAETALFRREQEFRAVIEAAPDLIARLDPDLRYTYVNPASERAAGLPAGALLGMTARELGVPEPLVSTWELTLRQVFATVREEMIETPVSTALGERTYQVRLAPELGPDGAVANVVTVARDVTERTRREREQSGLYRELLEREERLHALVRRALLASEQEQRRLRGFEELAQLTRREREILRLVAQGLTTRQIAQRLVLGLGTVKNHISAILDKLGVTNRTQAAVRAGELGLLDDDRA